MTYYSQHNICPMTTRLPAQTDTVMVNRNIHLEQVAEVMGISIDLVRSLNPMYRRDIVPGATELSPIRLPQTETGRFIDLQDSICNYRVDELLGKRTEVEVKDDVPTYYHKSKRYVKRKSSRYSRRSKVSRTRSKVSRTRSKAVRKKTSTRRRSTAKRRSSRRRR